MIVRESLMSEKNEIQFTSISKASKLAEVAEFWDTHSLDDYWHQTHEVDFDVRAARRRRVAIDDAKRILQIIEKLKAAR